MKATISGMKLSRQKPPANKRFTDRVAVFQPSLFGEEDGRNLPGSPLPESSPPAARLQAAHIQELNALLTAQYEMSPAERTLLVAIIEALPAENGPLELDAKPLVNKLNLHGAEAVKTLEGATLGLIRQVCWIAGEEGPLQVGLISSAQFLKGRGLIRIGIDAQVYPYLRRIKNHFAIERLEELLQFNSYYSKTFFELFSAVRPLAREVYYTLAELKSSLLIGPDQYERYSDLKRFVIERAQKDLEVTPLAFTFTEQRGHLQKVEGIRFRFTR